MFRTARRIWGALRGARRVPTGASRRDDTALLLKSPKNAARIRAALADLDAGRGIRIDLDEHPSPGRAGTTR